MNSDQIWRMIFTTACIAGLSVAYPKIKAIVLLACERSEERIGRRRGDWDPVARKRIPYWCRERGTRSK